MANTRPALVTHMPPTHSDPAAQALYALHIVSGRAEEMAFAELVVEVVVLVVVLVVVAVTQDVVVVTLGLQHTPSSQTRSVAHWV